MNTEYKKIQRKAIFYNQSINFFWSALSFAPVVYFCYQYVSLTLLYWFLGVSCLVLLVPAALLSKIQLSSRQHIYRRIGIRFVKKYTQDGDFVNRLIKSRHPQYKYVESRQSFKKVVLKSYMNEKFHYMVFIFFLCISIYAFVEELAGWGIFISTMNIIYNLYPIFLQQYNRIRISQLIKRQSKS